MSGEDFQGKVGGTFLAGAAVAALGVVTSILLARVLGAGPRGEYALVTSTVGLVAALAHMTLNNAVIHYNRRHHPKGVEASTLLLSLALSVPVALVAALLVPWLSGSVFDVRESYLYLGLLAVPFIPLGFAGQALLQAHYDIRGFNLIRIATTPIIVVLLVAIAVAGGGLRDVVVAWIVTQVLSGLIWAAVAVRGRPPENGLRPNFSIWRPLLSFGAKLHVASVIKTLQYRADLLLVGVLMQNSDVGHYSIALTVAQVPWLIPDSVTTVLFPRVSAAHEGEDVMEVTSRVSRQTLLLTALIAVPLFAASPWLIEAAFGRGFRAGTGAAMLLLPGSLVFGVWKVLTAADIGEGRAALYSVTSLVSVVVDIALCLALVPPFGIAGAAMASTLGYLSATAVVIVHLRRTKGVSPRQLLVPTTADVHDLLDFGRRLVARARGYAPR